MRLPARPLLAVVTATAAFLALSGTADASHAKVVHPKLGVWEAAPKGVDSYNEGGWTLSKVAGRIHMTAQPDWGGIYYPNADKCHGVLAPALTKADYRLGTKGTFRITDKEANQTVHGKPLVQHVVWTGKWTRRTTVSGRISIWLTKAPPAGRSGAKPTVVCRDMHRAWSGSTP